MERSQGPNAPDMSVLWPPFRRACDRIIFHMFKPMKRCASVLVTVIPELVSILATGETDRSTPDRCTLKLFVSDMHGDVLNTFETVDVSTSQQVVDWCAALASKYLPNIHERGRSLWVLNKSTMLVSMTSITNSLGTDLTFETENGTFNVFEAEQTYFFHEPFVDSLFMPRMPNSSETLFAALPVSLSDLPPLMSSEDRTALVDKLNATNHIEAWYNEAHRRLRVANPMADAFSLSSELNRELSDKEHDYERRNAAIVDRLRHCVCMLHDAEEDLRLSAA